MAANEQPNNNESMVVGNSKPDFDKVSRDVHDGLGRMADAADTLAGQQKDGATGGSQSGALFSDNGGQEGQPDFATLTDSLRGAQQAVAARLGQHAQPTLGMGASRTSTVSANTDDDTAAPDAHKG